VHDGLVGKDNAELERSNTVFNFVSLLVEEGGVKDKRKRKG